MGVVKITIFIDQQLLSQLDRLVQSQIFPSRSQAVQYAVEETIERLGKTRLSQECAKLDPLQEQTFAEQGLVVEVAQY